MERLWKSLSGVLRVSISTLLLLLITACDEPFLYNQLRYGDVTGEIWEGHNANKIRIRCGKDCRMLAFEQKWVPVGPKGSPAQRNFNSLVRRQKQMIHQFLRHQNKHQLVYIAPCDTWPIQTKENKKLVQWVANEVSKAGYSVWVTQPIVPYNPQPPVLCVNLLRGKLTIIPPSCPNLRVKNTSYRIGSDFGCSTNRSLATMVSNPWDLLVPPGQGGPVPAARITHGNMNYNNGEVAKLLIERPYRTNSDYN